MNDRMTPLPFHELMEWVLKEKNEQGSIFGVDAFYHHTGKTLMLFNEKLETPFGPAAGPHTQLAQNIITGYVTGSRFFELKTVQTLDGEDLPVSKPCISAEDEGYNVEWSTELTVPEAQVEYIKAWYAIKVLSKEYDFGDPNGFIFNMSVGYDFEGITSSKINSFIDGLIDASTLPIWKECQEHVLKNLEKFKHLDEDYVRGINPHICTSITLSTLHGCPPVEIERIATYLIQEKNLHTYIKCNPTLLGYSFTRNTMDKMGYDYLSFDDHHFTNDLQFHDAMPMIKRLKTLASNHDLTFGVKLTNTFPVKIRRNELPGDEMYMSGRALYPLSISLAAKLAEAFNGDLNISYSGGADYFNIKEIYGTGVWPITLATTLLKSGGYARCHQIAMDLAGTHGYQHINTSNNINANMLETLSETTLHNPHYLKAIKPFPRRKINEKVPLVDCFTAPCSEGCPIEQAIPAYMHYVEQGDYVKALQIIVDKNPLPFITGTVCNHRCMTKCTRHFYEEPVKIRGAKLLAAQKGMPELLTLISTPPLISKEKVAIVGGGPAGLASAYFLRRAGIGVTIFEKRNALGGIVGHIVPPFRISSSDVSRDIELIKKMGVDIQLNTTIDDPSELRQKGYKYTILAVGAYEPGKLSLEGLAPTNVLDFLESFRKNEGQLDIGEEVIIIGGGNTAMDAARAAKRVPGVKTVSLVYRRTKRYMPADEEELYLALDDGVTFRELLSPLKFNNHLLTCEKMILGEPDSSGRRRPLGTGETVDLKVDTLITAIGEKIDAHWFSNSGLALTDKNKVDINPVSLETSLSNTYVAGDALRGPGTIVEAIADATKITYSILSKENIEHTGFENLSYDGEVKRAKSKKGLLKLPTSNNDGHRCLECSTVCESCVDVCPNRANVTVHIPDHDMSQIIHLDNMCNECGNCDTFCPYDSAPYKDKFTLFGTKEAFIESNNSGFYVDDINSHLCTLRLNKKIYSISLLDDVTDISKDIIAMMSAICTEYSNYNF